MQNTEIGQKLRHRLKPFLLLFVYGPVDNALQFRRRIRAVMHQWFRIEIHDCIHLSVSVVTPEWMQAGGHFVKHDSQRPDIRPCIDVSTPYLLRAHISHCPHSHARLRQLRMAYQLGQTKIDDFDQVITGDHSIRGFNIAV